MVPFFPKQISNRAIIVYLIALVTVSLLYSSYSMRIEYMIMGLISVVAFFVFTSKWTKSWTCFSEKVFLSRICFVALSIRIVWVVFSFYYYKSYTGIPFEYDAADSIGYHDAAEWLSKEPWDVVIEYFFGPGAQGVSDVGYPIYLTILYKVFGPVIIIPRLIKTILSAYTCILIYRLCARTFNEETARMACIMSALMPNFIIYCGLHLKETEMIFLEVIFLERLDNLLRSRKVSFWSVLSPSVVAVSLFFFRTVLGAAAVFSFATAVLVSSAPTMKKGWRRTALIAWGVLGLMVASGGTIMTEVEGLWEQRDESVVKKRTEQTIRGNQWAQYATGVVMAPMVFVLPFSTMIDVDQQYNQQEKHGGNFIRNFMGVFAIIAIYEAIRRKKWRDFSLIGSFVIAYLGVVSLSGFSNSERFLLPGLPCLIIMWAYGVSVLRKQTFKFIAPWSVVVCVMEIAWAFFKLGSRGLL